MVDIFVSYAHADEERVRPIVSWLERQNWTVFWDRRIPTGQSWRSHIGQSLADARCVLVAWSTHSLGSRWVEEEAEEALVRKVLVPVLLDPIQPPIGFRGLQAADLTDWREDAPQLGQLLQDIGAVLSRSALSGTSVQPSGADGRARATAATSRKVGRRIRPKLAIAVISGFLASLTLAVAQGWIAFGVLGPSNETPNSQPIAPQKTVSINYFSGNWKNVDHSANGLSRLSIAIVGNDAKIRAWGKCEPVDCDWGEATAVAFAEDVSSDVSSKTRSLGTTFKSSFRETTFIVVPQLEDQLRVDTTTRFIDDSGRSSYSSTNIFQRGE